MNAPPRRAPPNFPAPTVADAFPELVAPAPPTARVKPAGVNVHEASDRYGRAMRETCPHLNLPPEWQR